MPEFEFAKEKNLGNQGSQGSSFTKEDYDYLQPRRPGDIDCATQQTAACQKSRGGDDGRQGNTPPKTKPWCEWGPVHFSQMNKSDGSSTDLATFSTKLIFMEDHRPLCQTHCRRWSGEEERLTYCGAKEQLNDKCFIPTSFHLTDRSKYYFHYFFTCMDIILRKWQESPWQVRESDGAKADTGEYWWCGRNASWLRNRA